MADLTPEENKITDIPVEVVEGIATSATAVTEKYDENQIQVLEGLEAVRKRPGMYIGSTSASGLHHLVYEIVDNAIDEALAGYCTDITVTINPGDTITVTDNGRGIPVDIQPQTGRPALEVVYTVLHAGGKFGGGGYKVSGGLHGVGASVVNALSEWLEVQVQKDGRIYEMKFSRGAITQEMKIIGDTDRTGTTVTFKPDPEIFDTLVYDYDILHTRMREQAFLNAGLRITITDARPGSEQGETMCYEGGIREYVTYLNRNKTPLHQEVIYLSGAKGDSTAEIAMQYGYVYVAQVAMGADYSQTLRALLEAESYPGTSIIIAYAPCISHGIKIGMNNTMLEMKAAVQAGYWHLFRYDPRRKEKGRNPFQLDSPAPIMDYQEFLTGEVRYSSLQLTFPERATELFARAEKEAQEKYARLVELSKPWEAKDA